MKKLFISFCELPATELGTHNSLQFSFPQKKYFQRGFNYCLLIMLIGFSSSLSGQWVQVGNDIGGEAAHDNSGIDVSMSGNGKRVAIGAHKNDGNGHDAGHVRVYEETGGVWSQLGSDIDGQAGGPPNGDQFGRSVSLSSDGKRLAIGAHYNESAGNQAGYVRVYMESGGVWSQLGSDIHGEGVFDSAYRLSLSSNGKRLAIGAVPNNGHTGRVRIFAEIGGIWVQVGSGINGEAAVDQSGYSVSLSSDGSRVAIGAVSNDGNGNNAGQSRVFEEIAGIWTQVGSDLDGEAAGDRFGWSVSLSADGKRLAASGPYNDNVIGVDAGHIRVFEENGGVWIQVGSDIEGEAPTDLFGFSVSLSADGKRLASGTHFNDGNGNSSGHARIYNEVGGNWVQIGNDIDGEGNGDGTGFSVSLSPNGHRLAVGAISNSDAGPSAGEVRIYEIACPDADSDGFTDIACGGTDCDDTDPAVHPNAPEICNGIDDNCNGLIDGADPTVVDTKNPTPLCKNGLAATIPPAPITISGSDLDAGSFDNCGAVTLTVSQDGVTYTPTTDFHCPGTFPVYLGVTDGAGNFDYCQSFVLVQDVSGGGNVPPNVACASHLQVPLDANCQATINVFDLLEGGPYGADCYYFLEIFQGPGFTTSIVSGLGTVTIPSNYAGQTLIYQITNTDSGAQCDGTIELEDKMPPTITCPPDKIIAADENCQGLLESWPPATLSDNCSNVNNIIITQTESPANFSAINDVLTVTLTAEDESANTASCSFLVTLKDLTPPVIGCPGNQVRSVCNNYVVSGSEFDFSFISENCLGNGVSSDWALTGATTGNGAGTTLAGTIIQPGITTVQWTMTDGSGNPGSCSFNVTVNVASGVEICDGVDNDCDGQVDEGLVTPFNFTYNLSCTNTGNAVTITWTGGCPNWIVDLVLVRINPFVVQTYFAINISNTGSYTWTIPSNIPLDNYQFYIQEGLNSPPLTWTYGAQFYIGSANATEICDGIDNNCNGQIDEGTACCPPGPIVYVKANATGLNNGTSWADAYTDLQTALTSTCPGITQVWVAAGIYKPTSGTDRTISFVMKNNLAIYGGFNGSETLLSQRNWVSNVSVLSGDIGTVGNSSDNSYHVVFNNNNGLNSSSVLDGFTITLGNANGGNGDGLDPNDSGGGMYNGHSTFPTLTNCIFSGNIAAVYGGGMYNLYSSPNLYNCIFSGNSSVSYIGGGMYNAISSPMLTNCIFSGNVATAYGGGLSNYYSSPTIINCSFSGNSAYSGGGILNLYSSSPILKNSIIWGNSSGISNQLGASASYINTIVQGLNLGGGVFNGSTDPLFINQPNFNNAPTTAGDLHLQPCSPAIDAGTNTGAPVNDLDGNPRPHDGNSDGIATVDLGAYEHQGSFLSVVTVSVTHESCVGAGNGSITISASASCPGTLMYSISGGASYSASNTFNNLTPGTYSIKVILQGNPGPFVTTSATLNPGPSPQTWYRDFDNDGYSSGLTLVSCAQPPGYKLPANLTATSGDCNDFDANQFPGQTWYKDADNDGYSDGTTKVQCSKPSGYRPASQLIATSGDCKDGTGSVPGIPSASMANIHPGAAEVCNGIDDDCNGFIDDNVPNGMTYSGNVAFSSQAEVDAFPDCYSTIAGNVTIQGAGITDLSNLANITDITGSLTIQFTGLANLTGLDNLVTIGGALTIFYNNFLVSLTGLENLSTIGSSLLVYYNFSLTMCCPLEHFLITGGVGGGISIFFNSFGCNSNLDILTACPLFAPPGNSSKLITDTGKWSSDFATVFPNPSDGQFTLRLNSSFSSTCHVQIFDLWHRKLQTNILEPGTQDMQISLFEHPAGLYFIKVTSDGAPVWEEKIVKQ